jgi:wyosine [tRNA(Phe)-imidazoG37] synthetase (radical SAM superfamily)
MPTFLFGEIVFGPIKSRRLGNSLGVNLLPEDYKYCTFDCLYCECGWTLKNTSKIKLPSEIEVENALEAKLQQAVEEGVKIDSITFAGNGEPTVHPQFAHIINNTLLLRNKYFPKAKVSVLSNATQIHRSEVVAALQSIEQCILKLDAGLEESFQIINRPLGGLTLNQLVDRLKVFDGNLIIQTLFLRGNIDGKIIDNTTEKEIEAWIKLLVELKPKLVMIYPIERDTPHPDLEKVSDKELQSIASLVRNQGISVEVYS